MKTLSIIFMVLSAVSASKILAIVPMPTYSHQIAFRRIWEELSLRGHQVTLITTDPLNNKKLENLTEIDVHETYKIREEHLKKIEGKGRSELMNLAIHYRNKAVDFQMNQKSVKALINNNITFDAVIVESLFFEFLAFADFYNCPKILVSSFDLTPLVHNYLGNSVNPAVHPDWVLPYLSGKMSFYERLASFVHLFSFSGHYLFYTVPIRHEIMKKHFGENVKSPLELLIDSDLVLVNTNPIMNENRAIGPNVISFGGGNHLKPSKPLPKDLKKFLDNATEGFVYFSLGSNTKSMYMTSEKIQVILETLSELPYKVLWKFEQEDVIKTPKNIKLMSWIPQQDVLKHRNIKLFVTQGGVQSLEESILSHVPMVILPVQADQYQNAKRMQDRGFGRIVQHQPIPDKEDFKRTIIEVVIDPMYKQNVIKAAELILDQPMTGIDRAIWWIEYVLRHKGAKHLRNPIMDIPFYHYYNLDIMATIFVFLYVAIKCIIYILGSLNILKIALTNVCAKLKSE